MNTSRRLMNILLALMLVPMGMFGLVAAGMIWSMFSAQGVLDILMNWGFLLLLAFIVLTCVVFASFLSYHIGDQLAFLSNAVELMARGKNMLHIPERELSPEFRPLYAALKTHAHFHDDITARMKEMLKNFSGQPFSVRSDDDELLKTFNTLIRYSNNLQEVLTAISQHNFTAIASSHDFRSNPTFPLYLMIHELMDLTAKTKGYADQIVKNGSQIASTTSQSVQDTRLTDKHLQEIAQIISRTGTTFRNIANYLSGHMLHVDDMSTAIETTSRSVVHVAQIIEEMKSMLEEHPLTMLNSENVMQPLERLDEDAQLLEKDSSACKNLFENALYDAQQGKLVTQEAMSGMLAIQKSVEEFFGIVKRLGERSEEVGETLEVIRDIADHTTLLAINAAIISAHAGEHGRDFAVIANEIGKFAERTQDSATEIEELLQTISREFMDATSAMNRLSKAILEGSSRTRNAEEAFDVLRNNLLTMNEIVCRMAKTAGMHEQENFRIREALGEIEFTLHDKQDKISSMVWQLMQIVVQMRTIHSTQAENHRHIMESVQHIHQVLQDIEHASHQHVQMAEQLSGSIEYVKKLTHRTNLGAEKAAQLSQELLETGGNLVFMMGEFAVSSITSELRAPEGDRPVIALVKRGAARFFDIIEEGVRQEAEQQGFDILEIDSQYETTIQIEQVNWLLKLPMLRGIILCPTDPHIAQKLVQKGFAAGIPCVAADETIATTFSIRSGNREGGRQAAEILMAHLPPHATVGVVVDRTVESMVRRTLGFRQKAEQYPFDLVEIFSDVIRFDKLKQAIVSGIQQHSEMQGIFLPCERVTTAYLNVLHENLLPSQTILAVGYDQTPLAEQAIKSGELVGAIFQHPEKIGRQAFQYLHKLIAQHVRIDEEENRSIYIPTIQITNANLDTAMAQLGMPISRGAPA